MEKEKNLQTEIESITEEDRNQFGNGGLVIKAMIEVYEKNLR